MTYLMRQRRRAISLVMDYFPNSTPLCKICRDEAESMVTFRCSIHSLTQPHELQDGALPNVPNQLELGL